MPRPSNTDERRSQIADALVDVMASAGYDGASIADIAAAASLAPGLVHYHFANKREILLLALQRMVERHDALVEKRLAAAAGDPHAEIDAFIDAHVGVGADADPKALACWVMASNEALRAEPVREALDEALTRWSKTLIKIIKRGQRAGSFSASADPASSAAALLAAIHGYLVLAATARELIPRGSAAPSVKAMARGLLTA